SCPGEAQAGRHLQVDGAVRYRLPPEQQLCWTAGRCAGDEGRLVAGLRRLQRRGLPGELRHPADGRRSLIPRLTSRAARPPSTLLLPHFPRLPENDMRSLAIGAILAGSALSPLCAQSLDARLPTCFACHG